MLAKAEHGGDVFIDKIELDVRVFVEDKDREAAQECLDGLKSSPVLRSIGKGIEIVLRTALD